jgi:hypothetical protein
MPNSRKQYQVTPYTESYNSDSAIQIWQAIVTTYWAGYKRRKQAA